jgi:hypothetical protein
MNKSIVSDWNGTIYKEVDEKKTYLNIGLAYKETLLNGVKHLSPKAVFKLIGLLKTKSKLEGIYREIKAGEADVEEIYHVFNERVIDGLDPNIIFSSVNKLANTAINEVDRRILSVVWAEKTGGTKTGILSAAWERSIIMILNAVKYNYKINPFDYEDIVGDKLAYNSNGTAKCFLLRTYGRKGYFLEDEFARKRGFKNIIYFGDTEDDLSCFDYVTSNNGKAVLPFLLIERQKENQKVVDFVNLCTSKYNAFVPKDEDDLAKFLKCY